MFGNPFQLKSTLARNVGANLDDTFNTKKALNALGHYRSGTGVIDNKPDNTLFEGIRSFQSAFGLKRDGVMKPGGETERTLGRVLEKRNGSTTKPSSSLVATPAPSPKPSLLDPFPRTTPSTMPGEHDHMKLPRPTIFPGKKKTPKPQSTRQVLADGLPDLIRRKASDDEVASSNTRTVKAALKTSDHTGLAKMQATAVKDFGDDALAEVEEFRKQLLAANKLAHDSWLRSFTEELPEDAERMMLAGGQGEDVLRGGEGIDRLNTERQSDLREETVGLPPRKPESPTSESPTNVSGTSDRYKSPVNQDFRDALHNHESSEDGYKSFNPEDGGIGALGRYQMRKLALVDAGMIGDKGNWTGKHGVKNAHDFLNNPEAQERAFASYMAKTEGYLKHYGSYDEIGRSFPGKLGVGITVTENGLLAAAHRQGIGEVRSYLKHQRETGWTSDFSNLDTDVKEIYESVETRLRLFQNIPYR